MKTAAPPSNPPYEFVRTESLTDGVRRLVGALATEAEARAARFPDEPVESIHELRLVLKRMRALLLLLHPVLSERLIHREEERLAKAAKTLAPARDAGVGLKTLEGLKRKLRGPDAAAMTRLQRRFAAVSQDCQAPLPTLTRRIQSAAATVRQTATAVARARWRRQGWEALESSWKDGYRRVRRRYRAAHTDSNEDAFHRWRTASKSFMYQLALLRPAAPKRWGRYLKELDHLQSTLGREHDLAVLQATLAKAPGSFGGAATEARARRTIAAHQQRLRKVALKAGRRLLVTRPRELAKRLHRDWRAWRHS